MKTKPILSWMITVALLIGSWSCSKTEYFKSESKIKEQLLGSWNLIPIPRTNPPETWIFSDASIVRQKAPSYNTEPVPYDTATFTVNTSMLKVEIKIDNFKVLLDELNGTWQVVSLDDDFLVIATDHDGTSGILQREFQKRK
ncbi:MAG: hypothetical protein EYC69_11215 [Bacteroidetes bacterium]|nr:MAG: hypothetical protein EYC69_11215 [Bacteroidota bacterium]